MYIVWKVHKCVISHYRSFIKRCVIDQINCPDDIKDSTRLKDTVITNIQPLMFIPLIPRTATKYYMGYKMSFQ